jgi:MFS family permease
MLTPKKKIFNRIVWPFAIAEALVWASFYYSFPALLPEWEKTMGWSKTELSGAFTAALILSALLAPLVGRLVDRGSSKLIFAGSAALGAVMLIMLSHITMLWQFYIAWAGIGIAMAGALYEACFAIVTKSVGPQNKHAITLITLVGGFAGTVAFPSAHGLVSVIGWRGTVLVFAITVLCVALPLILYGCQNAARFSSAQNKKQTTAIISTSSVLQSGVFWFLALAF